MGNKEKKRKKDSHRANRKLYQAFERHVVPLIYFLRFGEMERKKSKKLFKS
jgi:hypothetical protein